MKPNIIFKAQNLQKNLNRLSSERIEINPKFHKTGVLKNRTNGKVASSSQKFYNIDFNGITCLGPKSKFQTNIQNSRLVVDFC